MLISSTVMHNQWVIVTHGTDRMKIFGGWLIRETTFSQVTVMSDRGEQLPNDQVKRVALTFVPDPEHMWDKWSEAQDMDVSLKELISPGSTKNDSKENN